MSARIMITVKDASRVAKDLSVSMMDRMLHPIQYEKTKRAKAVIVCKIDEENEQELEASKEPYVFTVHAGKHRVMVTDPAKETKQGMLAGIGAAAGVGIGAGAGGLLSSVIGADAGKDIAHSVFHAGDGIVDFELLDGDVLKLLCQPGVGGKIKIKVLE